ncbi:hypothetical protein [Pseudomonas indica]|uniref:hypothetical protein n=1 Tax=Pseudomonas indica TaxID=137658 RepID=UPI000BABDF5A|nr:hypothetical protein [Pseudomonas indica]PAU55011.1 hypothetical protein BZL42_19460 [Pseudomonas indica]
MAFKQTYKPDGSSTLGSLGTPSTVPFNNLASALGTGVLRGVPIGPLTDDASTNDETGLETEKGAAGQRPFSCLYHLANEPCRLAIAREPVITGLSAWSGVPGGQACFSEWTVEGDFRMAGGKVLPGGFRSSGKNLLYQWLMCVAR